VFNSTFNNMKLFIPLCIMLDEEDLFRLLCKDTSGAGTIYPSGAHEITSAFSLPSLASERGN
jgi:hypothetical protein